MRSGWKINYIKGDANRPAGAGNKIIVHTCNDTNGWGKGFVMAINRRWPEPEQQYWLWYQSKDGFALSEVQFAQVELDT